MSKKLTGFLIAGVVAALAPAAAQALPTLTITAPGASPYVQPSTSSSVFDFNFNVGNLSGSTTGSSIYGSGSTNNEITFASIDLKNNGSQTETFSIDITDPGFSANGSLTNELYTAAETFGGEIQSGSSTITLTTTATPNSAGNTSSAQVVQSLSVTGSSSGYAFGTKQATSAPTLVLSPGDSFTIDSNFAFTMTAGASVTINLGTLNDNGYSEVIPTGTQTPEPASAALAMGGVLPLFFLKKRRKH